MTPRHRSNRGVVLLEAAAGCALLIAATGAVVGFVALWARERDRVDRRACAAVVAANLLERLTADPAALSVGERAIEVEETEGRRLRGLTARLVVGEEPLDAEGGDDGPSWLAVRLELRWRGRAGAVESLAVATWCARRVGGVP